MSEDSTNEVRLVGRVAAEPVARTLPSGDTVVTFRVVVARPEGQKSKQAVDSLNCAAWAARLQRSVATWTEGDVVEVSGALRRRFFRGEGGPSSRVEVEVTRGRIIRRAASG